MTRIRTRLVALLGTIMALGLVLTVAVPANAYVTLVARVTQGTIGDVALTVDNAVVFAKQGDGTGVYVDWTGLTVNRCDYIAYGSSWPRWSHTRIKLYDGNTGAFIRATNPPDTNTCSPTWSVQMNGYDEGYIRVVVQSVAKRTDNGAAYWFEYEYALYPSGNSVVLLHDWVNYLG